MIGKIPPEIGKLCLERILLGDNGLFGTIPPELWQLRNLTHLDLELNVCHVSDGLFQLESLVSLRLAQNRNEGSCNIPMEQKIMLSAMVSRVVSSVHKYVSYGI